MVAVVADVLVMEPERVQDLVDHRTGAAADRQVDVLTTALAAHPRGAAVAVPEAHVVALATARYEADGRDGLDLADRVEDPVAHHRVLVLRRTGVVPVVGEGVWHDSAGPAVVLAVPVDAQETPAHPPVDRDALGADVDVGGELDQVGVFEGLVRVPDELYQAVRPMLATTNGRLILMSTPAGRWGHFWKEWSDGGDARKRVRVPGDQIQRIRAEFRIEEHAALADWVYRQEYQRSPCGGT